MFQVLNHLIFLRVIAGVLVVRLILSLLSLFAQLNIDSLKEEIFVE
jgi:hypothetical protein